jgi:protease I
MENILSGKKICILVASGFSEHVFSDIHKNLNKSGAVIKTVAPENGLVHGWFDNAWGHYFPVDINISEALGSDFDRLILPGGARAVEKLKSNLHTRRILRHFFEARKPIIAIEESIELLALCDQLNGLEVSAPATLVASMKNAGAIVSGQQATIDEHLLTFAHLTEAGWMDAIVQHLAEEPVQQKAAA